jgi:hypothetical protein
MGTIVGAKVPVYTDCIRRLKCWIIVEIYRPNSRWSSNSSGITTYLFNFKGKCEISDLISTRGDIHATEDRKDADVFKHGAPEGLLIRI